MMHENGMTHNDQVTSLRVLTDALGLIGVRRQLHCLKTGTIKGSAVGVTD